VYSRFVGAHSSLIKKCLSNKFDKHLVLLSENWRDIVGYEFAEYTSPYKLVYSKCGVTKLYIYVSNASTSFIVKYRELFLIDCINRYIGKSFIKKLITIIN
jgi:hypothetical protein